MLAGSFFFASMAVCVKYASAFFNGWDLVFWRGATGMVCMWLLARHQRVGLSTKHPGMHAWRSFVGVISLVTWFYAIAGLPVSTSMTLNYLSSVWVAAFLAGAMLLAWNPKTSRLAWTEIALLGTVFAGFAGVVLMLRPTIEHDQLLPGLMGLAGGLMAAFAYMQVRALGAIGEPDTRTVYYFAVGSAVTGGLGMLFAGASPIDRMEALWLIPVGVLATLGQLCMTRAYSQGATLVVASLQYSGIIFGAIYGVALFGDSITPSGWLGMTLIVASGIAATVLRARTPPPQPAPGDPASERDAG
jgi:drug/metabolite transporter (DMT)-like permease